MKRRLVSMCLAVMLVGGLSLSSMQEVRAAGNKVIDGSELTHDEESIGYDTKITRGEDLMTGYSKCTKLAKGKIYVGGTTIARHVVDSVQIGVLVERAKEEDTKWSYYDGWQKENLNMNRVTSNRTLYVEGDYYYRVRCTHAANSDVSSSFTNVESPSIVCNVISGFSFKNPAISAVIACCFIEGIDPSTILPLS